jgi:tungstate transport system substrate-binding protein
MRPAKYLSGYLFISLIALLFVTPTLAEQRLRLATTTSTDNSGLLDALLPAFEKKYGIHVDVIAVGTGRALKLGENGDVDLVLVHAREAEDEFVEKGFGVGRRDVMYNDFVLVGPEEDPARIGQRLGAAEALGAIARSTSPFISRGDDSGTHKKEKTLWEAASIDPHGDWYVEAGQGMGAVLHMADEKRAYTLTDRGTWIAFAQKLKLKILFDGDAELNNPYGIIAVNPSMHPHVDQVGAAALIEWITSPDGQRLIADFKRDGDPLFFPLKEQADRNSEKVRHHPRLD